MDIYDEKNEIADKVLERLLTAIPEDTEYRQILLNCNFKGDEEADRVTAAIAEARRYGLPLEPILNWCMARSSGYNKEIKWL